MARVLIPLAEGFEELEAVTVIDLLRRAGIEVVAAGLQPGPVRGSRATVVVPDASLDEALEQSFDMVVLPGGMPGAKHLDEDPRIHRLLKAMDADAKHIAAICAAPRVLASAGLLAGKTATAFPGVLEKLAPPDVRLTDAPVAVDGRVVTSRGPGTAMDFALQLIAILAGEQRRDEVEAALQRPAAALP